MNQTSPPFLRLVTTLALLLLLTLTTLTCYASALRLTLSIDKVKYVPGDEVRVSVYVSRDGVAVEGASVGIVVYNPEGGVAFVTQLTTGSDGRASTSFKLPRDAILGTYRVEATASYGGESDVGTASFTVKLASSITCAVAPSSITIGGSVTVSGRLSPAIEGATVTLTFTRPDGSTVTRSVAVGPDGSYSLSFKPDVVGSWSVKASWPGDASHYGCESPSVGFVVRKVSTSLSLTLNATCMLIDERLEVRGRLSPPMSASIALTYVRPDGSTVTRTVRTSPDGSFSDIFKPDMEGSWRVEARYGGDARHEPSSASASFVVTSREHLEGLGGEERARLLELMEPEDAALMLEELPLNRTVETVLAMNPKKAAEVLELTRLNVTVSVLESTAEASALKAAEIVLNMSVGAASRAIVAMNATQASRIIGVGAKADVKKVAEIVDEAVKEDVEATASIAERLDAHVLALILAEMARLPASPETAAMLLERLSLELAVEVVKCMIGLGRLSEVAAIFDHLSTSRLNAIYGSLSVAARSQLLPHLSSAAIARLSRELIPLPDLKLLNVTVEPREFKVGTTYTFKVEVVNEGNVEANESAIRLEVDGVVVDEEVLLPLGVGEVVEVALRWTPSTPGAFSLSIYVDPADEVWELNEGNNVWSLSPHVRPLMPDLVVSIVSLPEVVEVGSLCEVVAVVKNVGEVSSPPTSIALLVNGTPVEVKGVGGLEVGEEVERALTWTPRSPGLYEVEVIVDLEGLVEEVDEGNNAVEASIRVLTPPWYREYWWAIVVVAVIIVSVLLKFWRGKAARRRGT